MNFRILQCSLLVVLLSAVSAFAAEPKLTLYVPFDGTINAAIAGGNAQGKFGKDKTPLFTKGISNQGLLSGAKGQQVTFDGEGNISPDHWTITFWMKGLPGATWYHDHSFQVFWKLTGAQGEQMWFYKYTTSMSPWLFAKPRKGQGKAQTFPVPKAPEEEWHYWAVSWRRGGGAYLYLDGRLAGHFVCSAPGPVKSITIGQLSNPHSPPAQNKIIDEFKIYDAVLDGGAIARHYWQERNLALQPVLTVAPTRQKIIVDGKIDPMEWQNAAGFTGLIDKKSWKLEAPATQGKITYDDQNLYLAMHSDNPAEVKNDPDNTVLFGFLKKTELRHDGNVNQDDSFFFRIMPDLSLQTLYNFGANVINTIYSSAKVAGANESLSWEPKALVKSSFGMDGWSMEAAIPLKSLGIDSISDGASWRMNFERVWKMLRQRTDVWAAGQRVDDQEPARISRLGTVNFSTKPDAVVNLQQFEITSDGHVAVRMSIYNPGVAPQEMNLFLNAGKTILKTQKVRLKPGEHQNVKMDVFPQRANGALIGITVQSREKVLFHQSAPLILERVGKLMLWKYPSLQQIRLGWVIQSAHDPTTLSLNAQLQDATGKTLRNVAMAHLSALNGSTLIDVKALAPGKYTVNAQVTDGTNILQQQILNYEKKPLPSWYGNTLGISDAPPPPWIDVKVDKDKDIVSIWGRSYDYDEHLLPVQIINQGKPMLSAPMQLILQTAGGTPQSSGAARADSEWTKTSATRADSVRSQTMGQIDIKADSYVEFDGMTWMNLTVAPQSAKVLLNGLTLEIPLKADWAKLIKPYNDSLLQQTGLLPEKGWKGDASYMPWVGNADGGIQFFQETTASWIGSKSIEVIPDGKGAVMLRVHLIDTAATLDKPLQFAFGWITSPVKPAPGGHRDWRLINQTQIDIPTLNSYVQQAVAHNPGIEFLLPWWQNWWWSPAPKDKGKAGRTAPVPVPAGNGREIAMAKYSGVPFYAAPYGRLSQMGTANPWFKQFGDEWVPDTLKYVPSQTQPAAQQLTAVSQASQSLRDFYAWGYNRLLNEGNVHALYFDVSRTMDDTNIYHGAGTKTSSGLIEPTRNILGMRRIFKRIYTLMKTKHPEGKIFYHMSGKVLLPVDSFSDGMIDGENYTGMLDRQNNRGYENVLSVDQFRTEFSAQNNFGPASVILPEFRRSKAMLADDWKTMGYQHADYLLGLVLLHDSNIWWSWMPADHLAQVYSAVDATGLNAKWRFVPYWHQKYFSLPQGVYVSIYQSPDQRKAVCVVMNTSGKDQEISLPMALGKSTFNTATAVYPEQSINMQNGKISTLHITNNNFCAVLLKK